MFKKLVKVIEEFLKNHYLKSYGMKKTKLLEDEPNKEEEDEYDYEYDEDDENFIAHAHAMTDELEFTLTVDSDINAFRRSD